MLNWTNSSACQGGYWIRRSTSENGTYSLVKEISGGTNKKWTDTSVESGKRYAYIIAKECPPNKQIGEWIDGYNLVNFSQTNGITDYYFYSNVGFV